jgi:uracil-DNA glycosylase family protein
MGATGAHARRCRLTPAVARSDIRAPGAGTRCSGVPDKFPPTESFLPENLTLRSLQRASKACRGCPLYLGATQTVFGEGPADARIMLVGEQPGDREDLEGHPFVGPAGKLLDEALEAAGLVRRTVYVTNTVKHFYFEPRGKFRLHKRPPATAIKACRPWLASEIEVLKPVVVVLMGATAAQAILGASFRVTKDRGKVITGSIAPAVIATLHPSALLRMPDAAARDAAFKLLVTDLKLAAKRAK